MASASDSHAIDGGRREFLRKAVVLPAALVAAGRAKGAAAQPDKAKLPHILLGKHSLSRLICGTNPFNAGSHLSVFVNRQMREYYTPKQIFKTLRRCQDVGINCYQGSPGNAELYRRFIKEGGKMHFISVASGKDEQIKTLKRAGCIAIAHHGEATDRMFKRGQLDRIHDYLKKIRDAGVQVGVSTHMPDVVDAVESKGWDIDYYMTCVYERHRSEAALKKLLGQAPIPVGEVYLAGDPPRMFKAMRATKRPCLAFKILAAGRLSDHHAWVERAFRETFKAIKPTDGAIVGIYDRYSDQPAQDAEFVRRFGPLKTSGGKTQS